MGALTTPRNPEECQRAHVEPSQALHINMNRSSITKPRLLSQRTDPKAHLTPQGTEGKLQSEVDCSTATRLQLMTVLGIHLPEHTALAKGWSLSHIAEWPRRLCAIVSPGWGGGGRMSAAFWLERFYELEWRTGHFPLRGSRGL